MNNIILIINSEKVDVLKDTDLGFRLNRFVQDAQNFNIKGGDTSTTIQLPYTKTNSKILNVSNSLYAINKFNRNIDYIFELNFNGVSILKGTCLLKQISKQFIEIELYSSTIDWISKLDEIALNRLGFVNGAPTWFGAEKSGEIFEGGKTINILNNYANIYGAGAANRYTDYICPLLLRYTTPITDYLDEKYSDIFGVYDGSGNQIQSPLSYPDAFKTIKGFFGNRQGLNYDDLPPAVYYRNIVEKCFNEIGYNVKCSLFNEVWFNSLYIPFKGDAYKYNWKTLAELQLRYASAHTEIEIPPNGTQIAVGSIQKYMGRSENLMDFDDLTQRVDRVTNFKKFLISDEDPSYVVPVKGKYKIRVISQVTRKLTENGSGKPLVEMDRIGSFNPVNYGWDDNLFIVYRKTASNEFVFTDTFEQGILYYMSGLYPNFTNQPSDIIAYVSPKRCILLGDNDPEASGSPLNNFQTDVNIINRNHVITNNTVLEKSSFSSTTFEIEIDLQANERIFVKTVGFMDVELVAPAFPVVPSSVGKAEIITNSNASQISIELLCGYEDISISENLPNISAKDFISNFIKSFNLRFYENANAKTVNLLTEQEFFNIDSFYDITQKVSEKSIKIYPTNTPEKIVFGYENDENDFELNELVSECIEDVYVETDYANKVIDDNLNIYAHGEQNFKNGFSATKFIEADLSGCLDYNTIVKTLITLSAPIVGVLFTKGVEFTGRNNFAVFRLKIPSLIAITDNNVTTFENLEYNFDQELRVLQFLGTVGEVTDLATSDIEDYRFKIDAPDFDRCLESDFWIQPTISSFDLEDIYYNLRYQKSNMNVPEQSMRYDTQNGLYFKFFNEIIKTFNSSYILECDMYMSSYDWNQMQPNKYIKYNGEFYRILEISDYDITARNPSRIKLLKLV